MIYYSIIYPHIIYVIIVWGGTYGTHLNKLEVSLNKVVRLILGVGYDDNHIPLLSTAATYSQLGVLRLGDIYRLSLLRFVHSLLYGSEFALFLEYFSPCLPAHNYNMRSARFNLPVVRLDSARRSTIFKSVQLMNDLPAYFLEPHSWAILKIKYKNKILNEY